MTSVPTDDNPYQPPTAGLENPPTSNLIEDLKSMSTWALFGLGVITIGIY